MQQNLLGLLLAVLMLSSCSESSTIGSEVLDDEKINIQYKDDFKLKARTTAGEPLTFDLRSERTPYSSYLVGSASDPIFGTYSSELYFSFTPISKIISGLGTGSLDSVVLSMAYDTIGAAGDLSKSVTFLVHQLEEDILGYDTLSTEKKLLVSSEPIGEYATNANPKEKLNIYNPVVDSVENVVPQLRIKLSNDFGKTLFADSTMFKSDTLLRKKYKGFKLSVQNGADRMVALQPRRNSSRLTIYYKDNKGKNKVYRFGYRTKVFQQMSQDLSGSKVEQIISQPSDDDDVYIQGLKGTDIEVELPDMSAFKNSIINYAYLEMTVSTEQNASLPHASFSPYYQLFASNKNSAGKKVFVDDILKFGNSIQAGIKHHEGLLREVKIGGETVKKVRFVITDYVKGVIKGSTPNICYLRPLRRTTSAQNTIFYGANHSQYPIQLKIAYTNN